MAKIISSATGLVVLMFSWLVMASLAALFFFGISYAISWAEDLPIIGLLISFVANDPRSSGGPTPIGFAILVNGGIGGFLCSQIAFRKTVGWLPKASGRFLYIGFVVLTAFSFIIGPLVNAIYEYGEFIYTVNSIMLGIGGIFGARSYAAEIIDAQSPVTSNFKTMTHSTKIPEPQRNRHASPSVSKGISVSSLDASNDTTPPTDLIPAEPADTELRDRLKSQYELSLEESTTTYIDTGGEQDISRWAPPGKSFPVATTVPSYSPIEPTEKTKSNGHLPSKSCVNRFQENPNRTPRDIQKEKIRRTHYELAPSKALELAELAEEGYPGMLEWYFQWRADKESWIKAP